MANKALGAFVILIAAMLLSAYGGYTYCNNGQLEAQLKLKDQLKKKQSEINQQAIDLATALGEIKVEYVEITNEVIKYVETKDTVNCFDDDAIRLFNKSPSH